MDLVGWTIKESTVVDSFNKKPTPFPGMGTVDWSPHTAGTKMAPINVGRKFQASDDEMLFEDPKCCFNPAETG
ncbi:hypothetical protein H0H81_000767 [Sphagnurus paluster]|uniref:Uncharacterized protein n=1 Tax=Sphagnurus paluster TaxID=117069 RepID=A0A9P7GTY3_9AGAR|nr:hypothetical protein H0H81_000767 [Sphagnurus paluster]